MKVMMIKEKIRPTMPPAASPMPEKRPLTLLFTWGLRKIGPFLRTHSTEYNLGVYKEEPCFWKYSYHCFCSCCFVSVMSAAMLGLLYRNDKWLSTAVMSNDVLGVTEAMPYSPSMSSHVQLDLSKKQYVFKKQVAEFLLCAQMRIF